MYSYTMYFISCIIIIIIIIIVSYLNTIVYSECMLSLSMSEPNVAVNISFAGAINSHLVFQC